VSSDEVCGRFLFDMYICWAMHLNAHALLMTLSATRCVGGMYLIHMHKMGMAFECACSSYGGEMCGCVGKYVFDVCRVVLICVWIRMACLAMMCVGSMCLMCV